MDIQNIRLDMNLLLISGILTLIWCFIYLMNRNANTKYEKIRLLLDNVVKKSDSVDILSINIKSGKIKSESNFNLICDKADNISSYSEFLRKINISEQEFSGKLNDSRKAKRSLEFEFKIKYDDDYRFIKGYGHSKNRKEIKILLIDITPKRVKKVTYNDYSVDSLTGLINRNSYRKKVLELIDEDRSSYGLFLCININEFKIYNRKFGHKLGDEIIKIFATNLKSLEEDSTVIFRLVGDEFGVYRHNFNSGKEIDDYLENLKDILTIDTILDGQNIKITCSIGVAILNLDVATEEQLFNCAEFSMKQAKKIKGEGTVYKHFCKNEYVRYKKTIKKEEKLLDIIDKNKYYSVFQPIINLKNMELYGIEGLTRINDRTYRSIVDYLDTAKVKGLESYVSNMFAINIFKDFIKSDFSRHTKIFVNAAIDESSEIEAVKSLVDTAIDKDRNLEEKNYNIYKDMVIEVSERTSYEEQERLMELVKRYRDRGATIAIDDFGAGYANEALILKVKPDIVKLDRMLIKNIDKDEYIRTITSNTVIMLKKLGVSIVAEGIETKEEFEIVKELGIDYGQGYYIQKPTMIENITEYYRTV